MVLPSAVGRISKTHGEGLGVVDGERRREERLCIAAGGNHIVSKSETTRV